MSSSVIENRFSELPTSPQFSRPTFLMCPPQWFEVGYEINPWMAGNLHKSSRDSAFEQWNSLYNTLRAIAEVRLIHPEPGCPDMAFLGHGALVHHGVAALASFSHQQRRLETPYLRRWFQEHGVLLWDTPRETAFEGEGDFTFNSSGTELWAAHGVRTCRSAHRHIADAWHVPVRSLHLVDPRFYHLDTCFAPLAGGFLLYYPPAFDAASLEAIEASFAVSKRIAVGEEDATQLACSALNVGSHVLTGKISHGLVQRLQSFGFTVNRLVLGEFLKGGGGAKSLTLRLSDLKVTHSTY